MTTRANSFRFSSAAVCLLVTAGALLFSAPQTVACNIPVFRYALERWPAGFFEAVVFHRGPLAPEAQQIVDALKTAAETNSANLEVTVIDLLSSRRRPEEKLWRAQTNAEVPWVVLRAPDTDESAAPVWAGKLSELDIGPLLDSPARREIAQRVVAGESAIWLLVESGQRAQDDQAAAMLTNELQQLESKLKLPPPADDDPQLLFATPLRIAFSILRVSANSLVEDTFVRMLLHGEEVQPGKPVVFPIFGRGRALAALSGTLLSPKVVAEAAAFVCGACSCEVKELNPGKDLLLSMNWNRIFTAPPEPRVAQPLRVEIPPKRESPRPTAETSNDPNPRRGLKLLAGAGLAFSAIVILLIGVALLRSLRQR